MDGWVGGRLNGWMDDGWMDRWMDGWIKESDCPCVYKILIFVFKDPPL